MGTLAKEGDTASLRYSRAHRANRYEVKGMGTKVKAPRAEHEPVQSGECTSMLPSVSKGIFEAHQAIVGNILNAGAYLQLKEQGRRACGRCRSVVPVKHLAA